MERQLKRYIVPNILAMIGISCYLFADTFFISVAAGADGITALNLVIPVYGLIFAIGSMIGVGSATRYSLDKYIKNNDADSYFSNAVFWTLAVSSIFVFAGIFFSDTILSFLGADPQILKAGSPYLRIVLCFAPFFMLNYTFTAFVRNDNAPKIAMAATLISGGFNIVFDYIFMFPLNMGMSGAALATGLSPVISMSICMIHYFSKHNTIVFRKKFPSLKKLIVSCNLGIASFVGEISGGITTMIFNFILLGLAGNTAVAAYGIIANVALVGTALFNGISLGLQPVASAAHAQSDNAAETKIYRTSLKIGAYIAVVLLVIAVLFADQLISVFNSGNSSELLSYASLGFRIYFAGFLIASVNIIKSGFYSAVGKGTEASVIALSRGVISISVMAFLLSGIFGIIGVWLAFPVSEIITWLLSLVVDKVKSKSVER